MQSTPVQTHRSLAPPIVLCLLFAVMVWPPILFGQQAVSEADDQNGYHLPVIQTMAAQWPHVDLVNYKSATAPGYHVLLAVICRYVTSDVQVLRVLSSLFGLGLVISVHFFAGLRLTGWKALACTAPLMCSSYVLSGAMWLTTDNAAWMLVALALGSAVMVPATSGRIIGGSILTTLAVFVRQIHIWLIAPIGLASMLRLRNPSSNRPAIIASLLTLALPVILLGILVMLWHGLVPPGNAEINRLHSRGINLTAVPMTLALFGAFGMFFIGSFGRLDLRGFFGEWRTWLIASLALVFSLAVPTAYSPVQEDGRWGGAIWLVIQKLPAMGDRSMIVPPLAVLGALMLFHGWRSAVAVGNATHASLLLLGVLCWLAAQSMNSQVWQRYLEPMILITLPWLTSLASSSADPLQPVSKRGSIGPLILAVALLLLSIKTVYLPIITGVTPT